MSEAGTGAASRHHVEDYDNSAPVDDQYIASYGDLSVHRVMLSDAPRMRFYADAIRCAAVAGHVVVDCGAGSGVLSMLALRAGAAHVFAIEANEAVAATIPITAQRNARKLAAAPTRRRGRDKDDDEVATDESTESSLLDRLTIHVGFAETFNVDQVFDQISAILRRKENDGNGSKKKIFLVSEWMGFCLFQESMLGSVLGLRDRLRQATAGAAAAAEVVMIPDAAEMHVAPFDLRRHISEHVKPQWLFFDGPEEEQLDFSVLGEVDAAQRFSTELNPIIQSVCAGSILPFSSSKQEQQQQQQQSAPAPAASFNLTTLTAAELDTIRLSPSFLFPAQMPAGAKLHGFVIWFAVSFHNRQVVLSTGPFDAPTHWKQTIVMVADLHGDDDENESGGGGIDGGDIAGDNMQLRVTLTREERSYQIEVEIGG